MVALIIAGVVLVVVVVASCAGGAVYVAMRAFRDHGAAKQALADAQADPRVAAILGAPLEQGWLVQANLSSVNGVETITMSFPVHGPKGDGRVDLTASGTPQGGWAFSRKTLTIGHGGSVIDLLTPAIPSPEQSPPVPAPTEKPPQ